MMSINNLELGSTNTIKISEFNSIHEVKKVPTSFFERLTKGKLQDQDVLINKDGASPERGGGTYFPLLDLNVEPRLGRLLIWNNMALDGSPNPWTLHAGKPVEEGTKYIFTKWFRERPFS